ncbi:hypothetical protein B0J12DRAFT_65330 [Macrophomina phaseolina]|uniref:Uncharacterized protein n=1 Tax=Macrophomina phaseolina TaxID=35725 RepID=A0ABQ8GFT2_9PEZI|nr:hypothetical protein B0J12DRAFT_65330 [Macrophomina phaseolina]
MVVHEWQRGYTAWPRGVGAERERMACRRTAPWNARRRRRGRKAKLGHPNHMLWRFWSCLGSSPAPSADPRCHMAWPVNLISFRLFLALFERGRRCSRGWRSGASQMNETNIPSIIRGLAATLLLPRASADRVVVARSCVAGIHRRLLAYTGDCAEAGRVRSSTEAATPARLLHTSAYANAVGPSCTASSVEEVRVMLLDQCQNRGRSARDSPSTPLPDQHFAQPICQAASSTRCLPIHHPPSPSRKLFLFLCFRRILQHEPIPVLGPRPEHPPLQEASAH